MANRINKRIMRLEILITRNMKLCVIAIAGEAKMNQALVISLNLHLQLLRFWFNKLENKTLRPKVEQARRSSPSIWTLILKPRKELVLHPQLLIGIQSSIVR